MVINVRKEFEKKQATQKPTPAPTPKASVPAPTQTFTYGLGSPQQTAITKPGQTLPTTTKQKVIEKQVIEKPKSREQVAADTQAILDQLAAAGKRIDALAGAQDGKDRKDDTGKGKTVLRSVANSDGTVTIFYSDGTSETFGTPNKTPAKKEVISNVAYDTIQKILESYRITGLASVLETIRDEYPEASSDDIITLLQFDPRYNAKFNERFAANVKRQKAGKSVYSPGEYLALEQGFQKVFDAYNLPKFKTQLYYDDFIEKDIDTVEVTERVQLAYDRVLSDDPVNIAFKQFFPSLGFSDIVAGMLDPVNQLPALQQKVRAAEIGGAALRQGFKAEDISLKATSKTLGAEVLAKQGVTKAEAEEGYKYVAEVLPTAEKLSSIYGGTEEQYGKFEAEQEKLLKLASAERKRKRISELELLQFKRDPGLAKGALSSITNI